MEAMRQMPQYRSHKKVWALKISKLEQREDGVWMTPKEEGFACILLPKDYVSRHNPQVGGYYVVYEDGYASWSPAKAFEDGYTPIQ